MKELTEYREKLLARLRGAAAELRDECAAVENPFAPLTGEWTAHRVAFFLRGMLRDVYAMRARRTWEEDNPLFENFDADSWIAQAYNRDEALEKILDEFSASANDLCDFLSAMPTEGWSRLSRHAALGKGLTLQLWVERGLAHIEAGIQKFRREALK
ncbi:MAG: hypothetical protein LC099_03400 [Anaerolineales bacterium]|nr:hypothetical protein [Anaerolineales bacterium]